jgi:hypothetical protein
MSRAAHVRTFIRLVGRPWLWRVLFDAVHSDDAYLHPGAQVWLSPSIFKGLELQSLLSPTLVFLVLIMMTGRPSGKLAESSTPLLPLTSLGMSRLLWTRSFPG